MLTETQSYYSIRVQTDIGVRCFFLSIRVPEQICNFPLCRIGWINLDKIKNTNWFAGLFKRRALQYRRGGRRL